MLAAVTLFASCSQEEIVSQTGGESLVSFTVTTPELGSRAAEEATTPAIGTGATATDLYYAVYDETIGEIVTTLSKTAAAETITAGASKEISLPLLNGHKYSLLFWAENAEGAYKIDFATKSISLKKENFTLTSNNENYDAFYAYVAPFTVTGTKSSTIQLKRPFAQLNIGTTATDLKGVAEYYGINEFTQSKIVVTAPTAMDLTSGNVSGEKELTYAAAAFISKGTDEEAANNLKQTYAYLSMNYLLVSGDKSLTDVDFSITDGTKTISKTFENIPVQRNYKTNIYGDLFTSTTGWIVEVAPGFTEPEFGPAAQLAALFEQGGEMTLYTDVEIESGLIANGKDVTLNLNGNSIISKNAVYVSGTTTALISAQNGAVVTIKGEGTIDGSEFDDYAVEVRGGIVNIEGGNFIGSITAVNVIEGTAYIKGGKFSSVPKDEKRYVLNCIDIPYKEGKAKIVVTGGVFEAFDPSNNESEGNNTNYLPKEGGYTSVQVGDNYVVVEGTPVTTTAELTAAINNATVSTVTLMNDLETSEVYTLSKDLKVVLNGNDLDASACPARPFDLQGGNLTIIGGTSKVKVGKYGLVNVGAGVNAKVVLDGGIYEGNTDNGAFLKPRGAGNIEFTLNNVKYTDSSSDGYILNAQAYDDNATGLVVKVDGCKLEAAGGFQGLCTGSSIVNSTIKSNNSADFWDAVEFSGDATIENSTVISKGTGISTSFKGKSVVKNCTVKAATHAFAIYSKGGEIKVVGGSYEGDLYVSDLEAGATAKIIVNDVVEVEK